MTPAADDGALALMESALALVPRGDWAGAARELERAAALHARAGRDYDHARCLQLAATLRRSAGDTAAARSLAGRAAAVAPPVPALAVSILAEQATEAHDAGRMEQAAELWTAALEHAGVAGLKAEGRSAILRRRAAARLAVGRPEQAAADFTEAARLLESADPEWPLWVRLEHADLLREHGRAAEAAALLEGMGAPPGAWLRAELELLRGRLASAGGRPALDFFRAARAAALEAVAPLSYFAAAAELAEALRAAGDLAGAYGTLATAWATLGDVLGGEAARSWVEPCLLAYRANWGEARFRAAKAEYEAARRRDLAGRGNT